MFMLSQILGWSLEQVTLYIATVRKEMRAKKVHSYFELEVVYGRKPE